MRPARRSATSQLTARLSALKAPDATVRKQFVTSLAKGAVDETARTVRFHITTGAVDRDNDTINAKGWDVSDYLRSPVILWAHDYSQPPVARALDITPTDDGLDSTAQFPPKGVYAFADTVFDLVAGGFLNASSVGFKPVEYERDEKRDGINFTRQSLLEWSIVPVPANAEALVVARSAGVNVAPVAKWARKFLVGYVKGAPKVKQPALAVSALLTALDDNIDSVDALMDTVLEVMGIPDVDTPADDYANGDMMGTPASGGAPATGTAAERPATGTSPVRQKDDMEGDGAAPVPGLCPACGLPYDGAICDACGWHAPPSQPMLAPVESAIRATRALAQPQRIDNGWAVTLTDEDPLRWNRTLSKAFDVAGEPLEPSRLELSWVSRYLDTKVQDLSVESFDVPSARMGSFLAALDEGLGAWTVDACRSMTESGREVPPEYESLQLNSTTTRSFLVEGIRFLRRPADGVKLVSKLSRGWWGLHVTQYIRHEQAAARTAWTERVLRRAGELNYLRGEAFTLSGEFLDRGTLDWGAMFLEPAKEAVLRRTVDRLNEQGEELESRGLMLLGPPGTGKTLSGRVMMRQADTTFIWISARDFYRSGAFGAFTYAFDLAAECAPTILFFEDVDNWLTGLDTIDLLKTEMDGLKRRKGILTVLTTNFPELLPEALIDRPGRFHDLLELSLPPEAVRARMLAAWLPEAPEQTRAETAKRTDGFSGAHLRELVNFAGTIQRESQVGLDEALPLALEKLNAQRALVASLHEASDYRPRRHVRALVGQALALVAKRGRVLSAANETRLRTAQDSLGAASLHLDAVLGQLATQPAPEAEAARLTLDGEVLTLDAEDGDLVALALTDEDDELASDDDLREALRGAVRDTVGAVVREQTQVALARARGRVD